MEIQLNPTEIDIYGINAFINNFKNPEDEYELNFRSIDRAGKTYQMKGIAVPIKDTLQNLIGSILMFYNATEEHKAEMELKESKELLKASEERYKILVV